MYERRNALEIEQDEGISNGATTLLDIFIDSKDGIEIEVIPSPEWYICMYVVAAFYKKHALEMNEKKRINV